MPTFHLTVQNSYITARLFVTRSLKLKAVQLWALGNAITRSDHALIGVCLFISITLIAPHALGGGGGDSDDASLVLYLEQRNVYST